MFYFKIKKFYQQTISQIFFFTRVINVDRISSKGKKKRLKLDIKIIMKKYFKDLLENKNFPIMEAL
ncbi:MAG: hypothetical protein COV59_01710 [Candidatus Magasanikbacteria bacterium CG11_big_fil_rev_8_21_14_0_20_39_34]|uniref:Uncharacterized protein n=1 Tax=Candidatus Magasanikbacteria bacterium CG11_big_fil_rev_8_21_14_0_20_39_34 TaxID=1974653 RepID=A0A2H0N624_9BACT|nr:MAG: hypothetical protein COV59_01710 [Candidatus Magasanikbacteria bacterium CG11_big_fil_rev_8_21_14_0_20_39_34]